MSDAPAPDPLVTFAYLSTARQPLDALALQGLLDSAQRFNASVDVTGMLLYNGGSFMQVLEGPPEAVRQVFEQRIRHSPMHGDIVELLCARASRRHFPGWSMACKHVPGQPLPELLAQPDIAGRYWGLLDFWMMWETPLPKPAPEAAQVCGAPLAHGLETTRPACAGPGHQAQRPA